MVVLCSPRNWGTCPNLHLKSLLLLILLSTPSECSQEKGGFERFEKPMEPTVSEIQRGKSPISSIDLRAVKLVGKVNTEMQCTTAQCQKLPNEECNAFEIRGPNRLCPLYTLESHHLQELDLSQLFVRQYIPAFRSGQCLAISSLVLA